MNLYELAHFSVLAFGSLFVIVDPIATVPAFLAMTPSDTPAQRIRTARLACMVMAVVLLVFALAGKFFSSSSASPCRPSRSPRALCC